MKIIAYVGKDKFPHFECWIDDALPADKKPKNNWKLFYKCVDKNDWDGPAYTENQGIANGGNTVILCQVRYGHKENGCRSHKCKGDYFP